MATLSKRAQFILWIAAAVTASAVLAGVLVLENRPVVARRAEYIIGVPEKGAALFFGSKECATCHAVNGHGGRVAPDLSGKRPGEPAMGWLTAVLWNHAPGMYRQMRRGRKAYPQLQPEEMAHILAFLYQSGNEDRPGNADSGAKVFRDKHCAQCHSVRQEGGKSAPDLATVAATGGPVTWMRAMWNHAQSMIGPITSAVGKWPQFSDAEMNDLIAYVSLGTPGASVDRRAGGPERGWTVFQAKCIQCHAVRGQGGHAGPELGPENNLPLSTARLASVLWNHAPAMLKNAQAKGMAAPTLQGVELSDLQLFLTSLRYFEPSGSPFPGERAFTERGCARCHGPAADGTREGPRLRTGMEVFTTVSFASALWRHGPKMIDHTEKMGVEWPLLAPTDVGNLVSFLNSPIRQD